MIISQIAHERKAKLDLLRQLSTPLAAALHRRLVRVEVLGEKMALGDYWGLLGDETRSWLDHLATGKPCPHTTAEEARQTLGVTSVIDLSVRTGKAVQLPLPQGIKD